METHRLTKVKSKEPNIIMRSCAWYTEHFSFHSEKSMPLAYPTACASSPLFSLVRSSYGMIRQKAIRPPSKASFEPLTRKKFHLVNLRAANPHNTRSTLFQKRIRGFKVLGDHSTVSLNYRFCHHHCLAKFSPRLLEDRYSLQIDRGPETISRPSSTICDLRLSIILCETLTPADIEQGGS